MRVTFAAIGVITTIMATSFAAPEAHARMAAPGLSVPSLVEEVACRVVRQRTVRPNGRVVFTTKRICGPGRPDNCRVSRERVVRPNGSVVFRTVRRCR